MKVLTSLICEEEEEEEEGVAFAYCWIWPFGMLLPPLLQH